MSRASEPTERADAEAAAAAPSRATRGCWLDFRYRVEYAFFLLVAAATRALPLDLAASWSGWCWRQLGRFNSRSKRALAQIEAAMPELSAGEREAVVTQMWDNLGRVFAESFHVPDFIDDPSRFTLTREEELAAFAKANPCILFVSLHSANWELAALGPARIGLRIAGIYQAIKNPYVDAYVTRLRRPLYPVALLPKARGAPRRLIKLLREGVPVAMMSDQREARGVEVPFFGRLAPSTSFPALLAVADGLPILAARTVRLSRSHFRADWQVIEAVRGGTRDENVRATTARIQACFEGWVRERPGEWMWVHRRWA